MQITYFIDCDLGFLCIHVFLDIFSYNITTLTNSIVVEIGCGESLRLHIAKPRKIIGKEGEVDYRRRRNRFLKFAILAY